MTGNIYITGQIGDFDDTKGVNLVDIIGQVKAFPEATEFRVHINSEGGVVDVGMDIYNYLKSLKKPITTVGSGIVASIATAIFMAGDDRQVQENCQFMIHMPWGAAEGTSEDIREYAKLLEGYEKRLIDFYKESLGLEDEAIRPLLREESWLTQEQLSTLGFTTSIPLLAVAKAKITVNTKNKDMNLNDKDRHWMESLFERVLGKFKKPVVNKLVQDANGVEIDFTDLAEDAAIATGLMAMIDGSPAEGEYVLPSGETYVFVAGELTEIKPADVESELDVANARIAELEAERDAAQARASDSETTLEDIKIEVLALKKQITSKFKIDPVKDGKKPAANPDRTTGMKEYLTNKRR